MENNDDILHHDEDSVLKLEQIKGVLSTFDMTFNKIIDRLNLNQQSIVDLRKCILDSSSRTI
jgi:hypothetical protein